MLLDFVDASAPDGATPAAAMVNQSDPAGTVSPLCGWLLPDHLDGALEVYDAAAEPLGMLLEDVNGAVVWEGAPGRPGPAGAPPSAPASDGHRCTARRSDGDRPGRGRRGSGAADLAAADGERARCRRCSASSTPPRGPPTRSARSAPSTNPCSSAGPSPSSGCSCRSRSMTDLGTGAHAELDPGRRRASQPARPPTTPLSSRQVTVRLGELTRTDDGVLGYFVDDDYSRFTPVSPEVLAQARASGTAHRAAGRARPE